MRLGLEVKFKKSRLPGSNLKKTIKETADAWGEITRRQFLTETDPEGRRWADLRPSTLKSKRNSRFPTAIGRRTGYAFYSSGYKRITDTSFEIGFKAPYLVYFHRGRGRWQRARPIYVFEQQKKLLDKHAKKMVKSITEEWED